jgi:hypothetical protein
MEHVYIRLVLFDGNIAVERLGEELKLYFLWEQRGINEETYRTSQMTALPMLRLADLPGIALTL